MRLELVRVSVDNPLQEYIVRYMAASAGCEYFMVRHQAAEVVTAELDRINIGEYTPLSVDYLALGPNPGVYRIRGRFSGGKAFDGDNGFVFSIDILDGGTK